MRLRSSLLFATALALAGGTSAGAAQSSASHAYVVDDSDIAGVMAADDERVAALLARDRARLEAVHSPELRYVHATGAVDDRDSYLNAILDETRVYRTYDYQQRTFKPIAPGIVLMSGRVLVGMDHADAPTTIDLSFLAVWRQEDGRWRFLAWQSSRQSAPPPAPSPAG